MTYQTQPLLILIPQFRPLSPTLATAQTARTRFMETQLRPSSHKLILIFLVSITTAPDQNAQLLTECKLSVFPNSGLNRTWPGVGSGHTPEWAAVKCSLR